MLLFISDFKRERHQSFCVSIHLMLLFITAPCGIKSIVCWFQYISCYSLSMRMWLVFLGSTCFNTSHVTLYRLFNLTKRRRWNSFNTSHVTLYQWNDSGICRYLKSFNTSHVTLYLRRFLLRTQILLVSIHLMLLFIMYHWMQLLTTSYVSIHLMLLFIVFLAEKDGTYFCFNTSHVTLYRQMQWAQTWQSPVSIHLMLLFILSTFWAILSMVGFNTSHVTLYPLQGPLTTEGL